MSKITDKSLFSITSIPGLKRYFGLGDKPSRQPITTPAALQEFLTARASHVAQTALYGYLKTRAGTRFPELFDDPKMGESIAIAKWQIWLACLSDLAIYAGVLLTRQDGVTVDKIRVLLINLVGEATAEADANSDQFNTAVAGRNHTNKQHRFHRFRRQRIRLHPKPASIVLLVTNSRRIKTIRQRNRNKFHAI